MFPFQTKRHFFRFYLVLTLMFLLLVGTGLAVVFKFYGSWGTPEFKVADYLLCQPAKEQNLVKAKRRISENEHNGKK